MFIDWGKHAAENYRVMLLEEMHANANCCQLCTIFPRMAAFGSNLVDHRGAMAEALPNPKPTALSGPELLKDASWFDANWPLISTLLCPVAFVLPFVLCQLPGRAAIRHPYVLGWLTIAFYLCHQTEEHGYDLRGWRYAFVPDFNHGTGAWLFKECEKIGHRTCPADPRMATYINVVTVWAAGQKPRRVEYDVDVFIVPLLYTLDQRYKKDANYNDLQCNQQLPVLQQAAKSQPRHLQVPGLS
ncbi:unnamed protein product [Durusdinium trenchii]|uniref:Uncharacterized protein n=1 Tax=Durusdinium trenchii TaxID=1381693 RepID=A0ABP0PY36_9DINO